MNLVYIIKSFYGSKINSGGLQSAEDLARAGRAREASSGAKWNVAEEWRSQSERNPARTVLQKILCLLLRFLIIRRCAPDK